MPIYEFYCRHCHRVFNFLSRAIDTEKTPACPRCGDAGLARRASAFAISKGRKEEPKGIPVLIDAVTELAARRDVAVLLAGLFFAAQTGSVRALLHHCPYNSTRSLCPLWRRARGM